jgi:hypothetical protein
MPEIVSLLPYLQSPVGGEGLRLSLLPPEASTAEKSYPFRLLDDSAPFSRALLAAFVTGAGYVLREVIIHVEKDRPSLPSEGSRRLTNVDIDRGWEDAAGVSRERDDCILLSSHTEDRHNRGGRYAPLFYCREKQKFFHPVCPSCGSHLSLCTDDHFLRSGGLTPYTSSAKRYLHCRSCCDSGLQEIYLYERDHSDPLSIKDRWSLIEGLGAVTVAMDRHGTLPCVSCTGREGCFGEKQLARVRITPFSFYPFHLLVMDAPSAYAADFLPLISGATPDELAQRLDPLTEEGRVELLRGVKPEQIQTLFRRDEPRFFLELLFLKLSFLSEVLEYSLLPCNRGQAITLDRLWISIHPLARSCRDFRILPANPLPFQRSGLPSDQPVQLALLWLQTLVSNEAIPPAELLHALSDDLALRLTGRDQATQGALAAILVPQNIFWDSDGCHVPAEGVYLWERACSLGLRLINGPGPVSAASVLEELTALLAEIRSAMFAASPAPQAAAAEEKDSEIVLRGVVVKLIERYRAEAEELAVAEVDEHEAATVIISPQAALLDPAGVAGKVSDDLADEMMETVILSAPLPQKVAVKGDEEEHLTETVLLPRAPHQQSAALTQEDDDDEPVLETVILHLGSGVGIVNTPIGTPATAEEGAKGDSSDVDLLETVLITPNNRKASPPVIKNQELK